MLPLTRGVGRAAENSRRVYYSYGNKNLGVLRREKVGVLCAGSKQHGIEKISVAGGPHLPGIKIAVFYVNKCV